MIMPACLPPATGVNAIEVGFGVGANVGSAEGSGVGRGVGVEVGNVEGCGVGLNVGYADGRTEAVKGDFVGERVGRRVGIGVGLSVGEDEAPIEGLKRSTRIDRARTKICIYTDCMAILLRFIFIIIYCTILFSK